ncbi:sulfurtransferase [Piscinibacter sp. HJYY11]|uniref:sulfurtransferase n=1 Tax=Piscinibacter sp. HJYY11 TaxID=2801333 RepID=UPI00191F33B3|nr:sulfurtransferase [Piscinibacter sp. HJYY11]MBL0727519.1 sulfurtransferase [Piscinibacter sp. HJYY11]
MHPLISATDLRDLLARRPETVLLDCSFDLADPTAGERSYAEGHLPGAHYAHLDRDLSGAKTGRNGRHPLRERADYAAWMGRTGIAPGLPVVVYDRQAGMFAVRAWWVLRWMGHDAVALLDGGLQAWTAAGAPLTADVPAPRATAPYPELPPAMPRIDASQLQQRLSEVLVLDARAPERYRGDVEPLDPVAGHIPGAVNRFFKDNLQPDGRFKPADQLKREFDALLPDERQVVHSCGSGVTSCHNLLAMEVAGFGRSRLYAGSWSEWCSEPTRPVSKGPRP